ncbi:MAG: YggS family pyridoxal phosphate-dependent enzyme [Paracoccaceae bacterium]
MGLDDIRARLDRALASAGRAPESARLIAVSKRQPDARVADVLSQGHRVFGENTVQEAAAKWPALRAAHEGVELHLLGPLQTNKARRAVETFEAIHSLDRARLADALARLAQERGESPDVFVQVNTGEEPQKAGVAPREVEAFVAQARARDLPVVGLMCIPPADDVAAPHFALLSKLAAACGLEGLSMGMSADFEVAAQLGATHVRVGSAIFGERPGG